MSALAIHLGAVALAKTKPPTTKLEDLSLLGDVELVDVSRIGACIGRIGDVSAVRADSPGSGQFPGGKCYASICSRASEGTATVLCQRNNGVVAFRESDDGVCAAPGLSVRSAPPTSDRIGRRLAHRRSNLGHCD